MSTGQCKTVNSISLRRRHKCIQSAFRRVTHQRPRRRRRRRVYFGPFRNNPDNNGVDQIVTRPQTRRGVRRWDAATYTIYRVGQ